MTVNFSKEQIRQNVTFDKLNLMIDQWTAELQENQNVFSLQYEELNKLMFGICSCRDKLKAVYDRIMLAKFLQNNIDQNLNYIRSRQEDVERMVNKLESDIGSHNPKGSVDVYRANTYETAEQLNSTYINFIEAIEELQIRTGQIKQKHNEAGDIEHIAQLLQYQLQHLETIEMKIQDMKNQLNQTEYYKQRLLTSLHLKQNTF